MAILYIQNQVNNRQFITPPYPNWGNIGKGKIAVSQKTGKPYPTETPHFNFTFAQGYEDLAPFVARLYGQEPMSLDVIVLQMRNTFDPSKGETVVDLFAPSSMQAWAKSKYDGDKRTLMTECDSHTVTRVFNPETKRHDYNPAVQCGFDPKPGECNKGCKATMRFLVVLPDLCREVGAMGYFTLTVHGKDDIKDVTSKFMQVGDGIGNLTWRFNRVPKTVRFVEDGKQKEKIHHPVNIEALIRLGGGMDNLIAQLIGNPTQADAPRLADTHYRTDEYEVSYGGAVNPHIEDKLTNPALWTEQEEQSIGRMVMDYLIENYQNVPPQPTDIFTEFGWVTSWKQLSDKLKSTGVPNSVQGIGNAIAHKMGYKLIETAPPPAPRPPANVSIADAVISVLAEEHGQNDVQSSDILHLFGVESWDELGQKWTGERTARALATEYMRLFVMKTREF